MREKKHIPFNKASMTFSDMERAVETFETIINQWHERHKLSQNPDDQFEQFFWEVDQQIHMYITNKMQREEEDA